MSLRIGFITPSLHITAPRWRWRRDPQIVKLGAPTVAGFLYDRGYHDIRLYDFEVQVFDLDEREPGRVDLTLFFDQERVGRFLAGDEPVLREQVELLLGALDVQEADLFGFSNASVVELLSDMRAVSQINMCLAKAVKERWPGCHTIIGGLKLPLTVDANAHDETLMAEMGMVLERCPWLDYATIRAGEGPMWAVCQHLEQGTPLDELGQGSRPYGQGLVLEPGVTHRLRVPKGMARQEGDKIRYRVTPEERPAGDHDREALINPSIKVTPYFDPANIERRKVSGAELLDRYHLGAEWRALLGDRLADRVAILPHMFMEGCNAACNFCVYSTTKMDKQEITDVVRAIAWMRERYGIRYFHFLNTNINGYYKYADTFCDALIEADLDILWSDCANLRALDRPLLEKMRRSGCVRLTFGLECPTDRMLEYMMKGITAQQAYDRLKEAHEVGIWTHLLLITGMPHETDADTAEFVEFLERTEGFVDGYSISSFYVVPHSLMGIFPERFRLELLPGPSGLQEDLGFHEIGGLPWEEKREQIVRSTDTITRCIQRLKPDPKYTSGSVDLELIFWLYDCLGHDAKADIVRAYGEGFLVAPNHPKYYREPLRRLVANGHSAAHPALAGARLAPRADAVHVDDYALRLPLARGSHDAAELELRCFGYYPSPDVEGVTQLARGGSLEVLVRGRADFADRLAAIVAPDGRFAAALEKVSWRITDRDVSGFERAGFVIEDGTGGALELSVHTVAEGGRAFLEERGLGFSYKIPHGAADRTGDPVVMGFLQRMGTWLLGELTAGLDEDAAPTLDALRDYARDLVAALERPLAADIAADFDVAHQSRAGDPTRHGDRMSYVPESRT